MARANDIVGIVCPVPNFDYCDVGQNRRGCGQITNRLLKAPLWRTCFRRQGTRNSRQMEAPRHFQFSSSFFLGSLVASSFVRSLFHVCNFVYAGEAKTAATETETTTAGWSKDFTVWKNRYFTDVFGSVVWCFGEFEAFFHTCLGWGWWAPIAVGSSIGFDHVWSMHICMRQMVHYGWNYHLVNLDVQMDTRFVQRNQERIIRNKGSVDALLQVATLCEDWSSCRVYTTVWAVRIVRLKGHTLHDGCEPKVWQIHFIIDLWTEWMEFQESICRTARMDSIDAARLFLLYFVKTTIHSQDRHNGIRIRAIWVMISKTEQTTNMIIDESNENDTSQGSNNERLQLPFRLFMGLHADGNPYIVPQGPTPSWRVLFENHKDTQCLRVWLQTPRTRSARGNRLVLVLLHCGSNCNWF